MKPWFPRLVAGVALCAGAANVDANDDVSANNPLIPPLFSLDLNSPEVAGGFLLPGDLLLCPDPNEPNMPTVEIPAPNLGLLFASDDVDALALGALAVEPDETFVVLLSVDREAVGAIPPDPNLVTLGYPFNVQDQAAKNQAASDAFISLSLFDRFGPASARRSRGYNNTLGINGGDAGGMPFGVSPQGLSPSQLNPPESPQSDVDAGSGTGAPTPLTGLDDDAGPRIRFEDIHFSLTATSPSLAALPGTGSGADIYLDTDLSAPGGEVLYVAPATLGLLPEDDIDAMIIFEDGTPGFTSGFDQVLFSLAPGSPSLGGGYGPGDVFSSEGFGGFAPYCSASQLGLAPNDNLNMLDYVLCDHILTAVYNWAIGYLPLCEADINGDGVVNIIDLAILLGRYGSCAGDPGYYPGVDLNDDGCVNLPDLATLLARYGDVCP